MRPAGSAGALVWVGAALAQRRAGRAYAWRVLAFVALSAAALALELFDFPPRARAWDAHALWHLATAPLPLLFYKLVHAHTILNFTHTHAHARTHTIYLHINTNTRVYLSLRRVLVGKDFCISPRC